MFSFSWVIGYGKNAQGGNTDDVQIEDVLETIDLILEKSGSVTLDIVSEDDLGPESLHLECEGGRSVLSLGENTPEDYIVRTYSNESAPGGKTSILGNEWDSRLICDNSETVKQIVKELFLTGNVPKEMLS